MTLPKPPNSRRNLDIAIDGLCAHTGNEPGRIKRLMAAVIVGQMLPDGAAKGGNALKIRFGKDDTRFSRDLDVARAFGDRRIYSAFGNRAYGGLGRLYRQVGFARVGKTSRG